MSSSPLSLADLEVGQEILRRDVPVSRDTLVRYAGASGDFNPIHYNDAFAESVGLPGVIAHGMLTMGLAISTVLDAVDDPTAVRSYRTRFTKPVPVPALDISAENAGNRVLGRAQATLALASSQATS
jgi:acyl dehydratase